MKKLYIHIGYPKTGTSAIQKGLQANREAMLRRGYTYYPAPGGLAEKEKTLLAKDIQAAPAHATLNPRIQRLIHDMRDTPCPHIILSSERFASFSPAAVAALKSVCTDFEVFIVVYLRRQDDYLQSLWSQKAKTGRQEGGFVEWVDTLINAPDDARKLSVTELSAIHFSPDYAQVLEKWAQTFGKDHILVRPFERSQLHPNIVADILQICGMQDTSWVPDAPQINVTPSMKTTETLRILGRKMRSELTPSEFQRKTYADTFALMQEQANIMGWNDEKPNYITRDLHDQIMTHFEESNRAVATAYLRRDQLFTEPFREKPVSTFALDQVSGAEMIDLMQPALRNMLQQLDQRQRGGLRFADQLVRRLIHWFPSTAGIVHTAKRMLR